MNQQRGGTSVPQSKKEEGKGKKRMVGEGLGCGGRGLNKGKVWMVGGASAQDPQGWKRSWGLWGVGLRLKEQWGVGVPPTPGLRGQETSPGSPAGFLGSSGWGKCPPLLSSPAPSFWDMGRPHPPASPDLPALPPMPPGPMRVGGEGGAFDGRGSAWELSRLPGPQ